MINVIVGIFVDGAMQSVRLDRDQQIRDEVEMTDAATRRLTDIFSAADRDRSGQVQIADLESLLCHPLMVAQMKALGICAVSARSLAKMLDDDRSGHVSLEEFIAGCFRLRGNARSTDMITLLHHTQRNYKKVSEILKEMRKLHDSMSIMLRNGTSHEQQGLVASFSPGMCSRTLARPADSGEPWIQPWKLGAL